VISRGTGLSVAFDSIFLLSQILGPNLTPNFGFPAKSPVLFFLTQANRIRAGKSSVLIHQRWTLSVLLSTR